MYGSEADSRTLYKRTSMAECQPDGFEQLAVDLFEECMSFYTIFRGNFSTLNHRHDFVGERHINLVETLLVQQLYGLLWVWYVCRLIISIYAKARFVWVDDRNLACLK